MAKEDIISVAVVVIYIASVLAGRKNDWNNSKLDPDPIKIWTLSQDNHDTKYNFTRTYAQLHNVKYLNESDVGYGVLAFYGSKDTYVYIENQDNVFDSGALAMSWMMSIQPDKQSNRSTLIKYQKQDDTVPFHLELLSNKYLRCTMVDTNGTVYQKTSTLVQIKDTNTTFIGINFNFLWLNDQFDFFEVYTDVDGKQIITKETFPLSNNEIHLDVYNTKHVLIGAGFGGNISCIQFYNVSVIGRPQKEAHFLCNPILATDRSFGDHTIDFENVPKAPFGPTSAFEESTTTLYSNLHIATIKTSTEDTTTAYIPTITPTTPTNAVSTTLYTTMLNSRTLTETIPPSTEDITTLPYIETTKTYPGYTTISHSSTVYHASLTTDAFRKTERCVFFEHNATDVVITNPMMQQTVKDTTACAQLCAKVVSCHSFSTVFTGSGINCSLGDFNPVTMSQTGSLMFTAL